MPKLALTKSCLAEYGHLPKPVQNGVQTAMDKFQALTVPQLQADKGLHLEAVQNAKDTRVRSIRVTGSWRGIVLAPDDGGETFLLLTVRQHDEAYAWAVKQKFGVNKVTASLEIWDVTAVDTITPVLAERAEKAPALLFSALSDTVLTDLGVEPDILKIARTVVDVAQTEAIAGILPPDQAEVLLHLAYGFTPEQVWSQLVTVKAETVKEAEQSLDVAIRNTRSRIALVSGPAELQDILAKPFDLWRIFLHPTQRRVAYRSYKGSAQVTGGPGTGKSVVALHRVKHLLESSPDARVLLTTYTTALVDALKHNLRLLVTDEEQRERVEVTTVNALARKILAEHGDVPQLVSDDDADTRKRWKAIIKEQDLGWSEQFLALEYRHVVLGQDITGVEDYLKADRAGRGTVLRSGARTEVWQALTLFTERLRADGRLTYLQSCADAAVLAEPRYEHVVVDEAQDLHPAQWRLLRAVVAPGPDDLFVAGDPHQRIYDCKVSLRRLGIRVAGNSTRLRVNYRSTQEILAWATALLTGERVDDLDEGGDNLIGYRSELRGGRPSLHGVQTQSSELEALANQLHQWIEAGVRPSEIAVTARFHDQLSRVKERLTRDGIPSVLQKSNPKATTEGVRLATSHAMKGLEFRCVAVIGVTENAFPFAPALTPKDVDLMQHELDLLAERCLLFVACTRAREALHVSWTGKPSPFLPV